MNRRIFIGTASAAFLTNGISPSAMFPRSSSPSNCWHLYVEQPNQRPILVQSFTLPEGDDLTIKSLLDGLEINASIRKTATYWEFEARVSSKAQGRVCFLSLVRSFGEGSEPVAFNGPVKDSAIYRQSPHEPRDHSFAGLAMQPVPIIALRTPHGLEFAVCDTPALYDNFTTQTYDLSLRTLALSSGDNALVWSGPARGFEPGPNEPERRAKGLYRVEGHYFSLDGGQEHRMDAIILKAAKAETLDLRTLVNQAVCKRWSNQRINDLLGATFFSTAYMNLRVNETKRSKFWVVPAIEYANKQYSRDAFWISMVLPPEYSKSCFENEASYDSEFTGAERQLFTLIWAYRSYIKGESIEKSRIERILRIVEAHSSDACFCGYSAHGTTGGCFQGWADLVAFDRDDVISNNQGLFVTALMCARTMGLEPQVSIARARRNYENLFNPVIGAYPISLKKNNILAVDPLMGDLLSQVYLGEALLPSDKVIAHYETMKSKAKSEFGFKVFCAQDGSYLSSSQFDSKEFKSLLGQSNDGSYQRGGSWYLYDMQMLMDAHLHGAGDAEDLMIWRTKLEFSIGGSTHEYIDTVSGKAYKPNMGWNAAVYGLWTEIMKRGKATDRFFKEIEGTRVQLPAG